MSAETFDARAIAAQARAEAIQHTPPLALGQPWRETVDVESARLPEPDAGGAG